MNRWMVVAAIGLTLFFGCEQEQQAPRGEGREFSAEVRETFLESCSESSGGRDDTCRCMLDELEDRMTEEEFIQSEERMGEGEALEPEFQAAVDACT